MIRMMPNTSNLWVFCSYEEIGTVTIYSVKTMNFLCVQFHKKLKWNKLMKIINGKFFRTFQHETNSETGHEDLMELNLTYQHLLLLINCWKNSADLTDYISNFADFLIFTENSLIWGFNDSYDTKYVKSSNFLFVWRNFEFRQNYKNFLSVKFHNKNAVKQVDENNKWKPDGT